MPEPDVWIVIHDDQTIEAFDTQDDAENSTRDDENPYIELVQIHRAPKITDHSNRRRSWVSPPGLIYTGDGGDAA